MIGEQWTSKPSLSTTGPFKGMTKHARNKSAHGNLQRMKMRTGSRKREQAYIINNDSEP